MNSLTKSLKAVFSETGTLSSLAGFEFRPQQFSMATAIASALESGRSLIVEAPTGVGKSLAYLIPALLFAKQEKRKAIVSTHTKNLQEQLLKKDLSIVRSLTGEPFDAVTLKGRRNYLCTTRLENAFLQQRQLFDKEEFEQLHRIKEWSLDTDDGDVDDLPFSPSHTVWQQVCSEKGACSSSICSSRCFFQKARGRARSADLVIMNHALFFTLFAMQESEEFFLFKDDFVVFDEAHTLEQVAGAAIGKSISRTQALFAIHRLFNPATKKGLFSRMRKKRYREMAEEAERMANSFFSEIEQAVRNLGGRSAALRVRTPHLVNDTITEVLQRLQSAVREFEEDEKTKLNKEELAAARRLVWEAEVLIREFLEQPDKSLTYWAELAGGRYSNVLLHTAPTSIAESLGPKLISEGRSVILTGATLSVNGSLSYFQQRIGALNAETLVLDSPFDFRRQMSIVLARDVPQPDEDGYEQGLEEAVYLSVSRSKGKALILFTNAKLMRSIAERLRGRIESDGIALLVQDGSTTRHRLLEAFKADVHSVLFGLDSFWMGVDVPGEALEHVIITKLPFAVPDHPLVESRMELIAQRGGNAFYEYTLPEAVLKLKQGVGRLIRSKTDKGLISILDSRILKKQYGRLFVQSLPECRVEMLLSDGTLIDLE